MHIWDINIVMQIYISSVINAYTITRNSSLSIRSHQSYRTLKNKVNIRDRENRQLCKLLNLYFCYLNYFIHIFHGLKFYLIWKGKQKIIPQLFPLFFFWTTKFSLVCFCLNILTHMKKIFHLLENCPNKIIWNLVCIC